MILGRSRRLIVAPMKSPSRENAPEKAPLLCCLPLSRVRRASKPVSALQRRRLGSAAFQTRSQALNFLFFVLAVLITSGCSLYRSQARKAIENDGINCARGLACSAAAAGYEAKGCRALNEQDIESFSPTDAHIVFDEPSQTYFLCR